MNKILIGGGIAAGILWWLRNRSATTAEQPQAYPTGYDQTAPPPPSEIPATSPASTPPGTDFFPPQTSTPATLPTQGGSSRPSNGGAPFVEPMFPGTIPLYSGGRSRPTTTISPPPADQRTRSYRAPANPLCPPGQLTQGGVCCIPSTVPDGYRCVQPRPNRPASGGGGGSPDIEPQVAVSTFGPSSTFSPAWTQPARRVSWWRRGGGSGAGRQTPR